MIMLSVKSDSNILYFNFRFMDLKKLIEESPTMIEKDLTEYWLKLLPVLTDVQKYHLKGILETEKEKILELNKIKDYE